MIEREQSPLSTRDQALVQVRNLVKHFPITQGLVIERQVGAVHAVDGISFDIQRGETLGLVGESGCGKTTAGRTILGLYPLHQREVIIGGITMRTASPGCRTMASSAEKRQMIFQDPYASLNPRWTVNSIISEPIRVHHLLQNSKKSATSGSNELLDAGGLSPPHGEPLPARILRRAAPADRDRPRPGFQPAIYRLRRADLCPGCLDPGPGGQPAGGSAGSVRI